jgi:hypothetical protein
MSITNNAGTITRDIDVTLDALTDYKPDKSPWVLVCNYMHKANNAQGLDIRTFAEGPPILPEDPTVIDFKHVDINSSDIVNGYTRDPGSWGHTGNELFNVICNTLSGGVADYAINGLELRFLAKTSEHERIIHFKTVASSYDGFIKEFRTYNTATTIASLTAGIHYELYDGPYRTNNVNSGLLDEQVHSAYLPASVNATFQRGGVDTGMTNYSFYKISTHHWKMGGNWEVDGWTQTNTNNTYHQIWVRANNLNLFGNVGGGSGLSVQSASILRTILDTVTFDPTGIAFTGSVVADENNTTNYYTLAITDPNLSRLQVVDLIENSSTSFASVGSNISANSNVVTDSILTKIVDVNSNVYSATAVNKAYVYTYAIDESGSNNHRDITRKEFINYEDVTLLSDKNVTNTSANQTLNPTFVGGEPIASSYLLSNGDIVYMKTDGGDSRDGAQLFDGNIAGGWANASQGASGTVPMTWAYKFTDEAKHVSQMKFVQPPDSYPIGNITISYYDTTWKNVTSPDKTGFNNSVAPVYAESITIRFDGAISQYWKITADTHTQSPSSIIGLYEWEIWGGNRPYVIYNITNASDPTSGLTITDATVFSSIAPIDKYFGFNLVTGAPASETSFTHLDPSAITDLDIITFTQTYLENQANISSVGWSSYPATGGGELSVYSGSNIQQYAVEQVPNMTFTHAFNTLTPIDSSSLSSITNVAEWRFNSYVIAVDTAVRYGLRAGGYDPFTDVASLSFRSRAAIASLADGTYTSSATLIYNGTTINSGSGVGTYSPGGYIIGTDVNGRKYMTSHVGKSFGVFDIGKTSFTVAFVISSKGLSSFEKLTYGYDPSNMFNIHFGNSIGFYPFDHGLSGLASSQYPNYINADYCLFFVSFNQNTQKITTILRTNTNHSHQNTLTHRAGSIGGYNSPSASSRKFTLITDNYPNDPIRVYDMLVFPGEYMTEDRATYPIFGIIEDYVNTEYGIVIP